MALLALDFLNAVVARLRAVDFVDADESRVRLSHRTPVAREDGVTVYVVPGDDVPDSTKLNCDTQRTLSFLVVVFVRNDAATDVAGPILQSVLAALNPRRPFTDADPEWYPTGCDLTLGPIRPDEETADADALRVEINFKVRYTAGFFSLTSSPT